MRRELQWDEVSRSGSTADVIMCDTTQLSSVQRTAAEWTDSALKLPPSFPTLASVLAC